jgi:hypothetical protein
VERYWRHGPRADRGCRSGLGLRPSGDGRKPDYRIPRSARCSRLKVPQQSFALIRYPQNEDLIYVLSREQSIEFARRHPDRINTPTTGASPAGRYPASLSYRRTIPRCATRLTVRNAFQALIFHSPVGVRHHVSR